MAKTFAKTFPYYHNGDEMWLSTLRLINNIEYRLVSSFDHRIEDHFSCRTPFLSPSILPLVLSSTFTWTMIITVSLLPDSTLWYYDNHYNNMLYRHHYNVLYLIWLCAECYCVIKYFPVEQSYYCIFCIICLRLFMAAKESYKLNSFSWIHKIYLLI